MRWRGRRQSTNVEDTRGRSGGRTIALGGIGTIILAIVIYFLGGNPLAVLNQGGQQQGEPRQPSPEEEELAAFVKTVFADTEDVWNEQLPRQMNRRYEEPVLRLFADGVSSGCGFADSGVGPFYCPNDQKVYIDLQFFRVLKERFQAPGDFAVAYVVAHEVGHHVQHLLGTTGRVHEQQRRLSEEEANRLSVRLELQADFYAGVWAHHGQKQKRFLEEGDVEEAIGAAAAVGDDTIMRKGTGRVTPDKFTHGTSEQRVRWFKKGFASGDMADGDTFGIPYEEL